ncbi:unnamed protein product [Porites evermanni]|uniref:Uncharacterized protein n=1 Tax=Porites evermanni TaxID=104178 RepID=A0ABN8LZM8_9CNID|nr:unnamed protein product [Porites evermanni]
MHGSFLFIVVTAYLLFCLATFPLQIAMIVMGARYIDECPVEDMIPIYLIVAASAGLFNTCCSAGALIYQSGDDKQTLNPFTALMQLFHFAWFIAGNVWIYSIYEPNYTDPSSPDFCNKTLYLFAFWVTNSYYILFGVVLGIVKCCTCCTCCIFTCCMGLTVTPCSQSLANVKLCCMRFCVCPYILLGKCYQQRPSARLITVLTSTLNIPDITKTSSNYSINIAKQRLKKKYRKVYWISNSRCRYRTHPLEPVPSAKTNFKFRLLMMNLKNQIVTSQHGGLKALDWFNFRVESIRNAYKAAKADTPSQKKRVPGNCY